MTGQGLVQDSLVTYMGGTVEWHQAQGMPMQGAPGGCG